MVLKVCIVKLVLKIDVWLRVFFFFEGGRLFWVLGIEFSVLFCVGKYFKIELYFQFNCLNFEIFSVDGNYLLVEIFGDLGKGVWESNLVFGKFEDWSQR